MTDEELKALVAENSLAIREMRAEREQNEKRWEASDKRWEESGKRWEASRQESERRWAESRLEIQAARQESEKRWEESEKRREESEKRWEEEMLASRREMDRAIGALNRELGNLGNKLGGYVEDMFRPSLKRVLREQFGMTVINAPLFIEQRGDVLEIDMVGHAGDESDEVYLVEIKSELRQDSVDQMHEHLRRLPRFVPEHRGKKLFGILAALRISKNLRDQVRKQGFYLATIKDDVFEIVPPDDFEPRSFGLRALG